MGLTAALGKIRPLLSDNNPLARSKPLQKGGFPPPRPASAAHPRGYFNREEAAKSKKRGHRDPAFKPLV